MAVHGENQKKMPVVSMLFVWLWCCFAVRMESERVCFPPAGLFLGVGPFPGRAETISTSNGATKQKTSDTKQNHWTAKTAHDQGGGR
jgi:hypothetical protein